MLRAGAALQRRLAAAAGGRQQGRLQQLHAAAPAAADASAAGAAAPADAADDGRPRVCVLGGGFGGLYTAIKLELLMWPNGKKPRITLVDQGERFVFKPLLYELLNGTADAWEVAPTFAQLLAPYTITFVQDKVLEVLPERPLAGGGSAGGGRVRLASGGSLPYDYLVCALGAAADPRGVPGVREHARPFVGLEDAEHVAGALARFEARAAAGRPPATVAVVGAGYAGVELAAVVAERLRGAARVVLLTPGAGILDAAPPGQREAAAQVTGPDRRGPAAAARQPPPTAGRRAVGTLAPLPTAQALRELGVEMMTGTKVTAVEQAPLVVEPLVVEPPAPGRPAGDDAVLAAAAAGAASAAAPPQEAEPSFTLRLQPAAAFEAGSDDAALAADLVLWTAGSRAASAPLGPLPLDARGQLAADATLRVPGHAAVFALGDVARPDTAASDGGGGGFYPATAQVAFQQADYAAWNVWAAINGRPLLPFRYQHLGDMMSLGAANAAVALPVALPGELGASIAGSPLGPLLAAAGLRLGEPGGDGGGAGVTLEGPLAQLLRRAAYLYRQPTNEQRLSVAASWLQQVADAAAGLAAELSRGGAADGGAGSRR
ncbi:NDC1 [Scenedesmus sp. PABB004]|nr:NDC1 [Scenedesmus sp. PABB004]